MGKGILPVPARLLERLIQVMMVVSRGPRTVMEVHVLQEELIPLPAPLVQQELLFTAGPAMLAVMLGNAL
jgi:hypothetical protein